VLPSQPDGHDVGFGAGVHEEADGQRFRHFRHDLFRAHHQVVVQESAVGVQLLHLLHARTHHGRMTVTDCEKKKKNDNPKRHVLSEKLEEKKINEYSDHAVGV